MGTRRLSLARHGDADALGELTGTGRRQAGLLGARLAGTPVDAVWHSPLPRAVASAHEIAQHLPGVPVAPAAELVDHVPYVPPPSEIPPPLRGFFDGYDEDEAASGRALADALVSRFADAGTDGDTHLVLVSHAYQVAWLVRHALDAPESRWLGLNSGNAALTVIEYRTGLPPTLVLFNDMGHLPADLRWTGFPGAARPRSHGETVQQRDGLPRFSEVPGPDPRRSPVRSSRRRPVLSGLVAAVAGVLVALTVATPTAAVVSPTPTPTPSVSTRGAWLSGVVTDENLVPVPGVWVSAYGAGHGSTMTNDSGVWSITSLPPGGYRVTFTPPRGSDLVGEYWDDAASFQTAEYVRLAEGDVVTRMDARLAVGATVQGSVTDASGAPLEGATVSLQRVDLPGAVDVGSSTEADGTYAVRPLAAGTYRLKVVPAPGSGLSTTYWPGVADPAAATPITLRAGQVVEGIDVTPLPGQGIAGRVVLPAGVDATHVRVAFHQVQPGGSSVVVGGVTPEADGTYRSTDLATGSYLVHVEHIDWNGPILPEYYRDALVEADAVPVAVSAGTVVAGIDLTPARAGRISGVVTGPGGPVAGVEVTLVPRSGQAQSWGFATTSWDGSFVIGRLPVGAYAVKLTSADGSVQYYRAPGGTTRDLHGATSVRVRDAGDSVDLTVRLRGGPRP